MTDNVSMKPPIADVAILREPTVALSYEGNMGHFRHQAAGFILKAETVTLLCNDVAEGVRLYEERFQRPVPNPLMVITSAGEAYQLPHEVFDRFDELAERERQATRQERSRRIRGALNQMFCGMGRVDYEHFVFRMF